MTRESEDQVQAGAKPAPVKDEFPAPAAEPVEDASPASAQEPVKKVRARNAIIFGAVVVGWLILDQLTKASFASVEVGSVVAGPFFGLVQFELVHNTGAAWGLFGDSTPALGFTSVVVCLALGFYLFLLNPRSSVGEAVGLSLVFAGGLGNAIDRFAMGYVVDFIDPVFIDFPVFNVADIGVTCGFIIFIISMVVAMFKRNDGQLPLGDRVE